MIDPQQLLLLRAMKPKESYLNYALLANRCNPSQPSFKEDIPIDLSIKKQVSMQTTHPYGLFKEYEHVPFHSPPHLSDWTTRYCFSNLMAKHYGYPPNIFPYMLINPSCLAGPELDRRRDEVMVDPLVMSYRLPPSGVIYPFPLDPFGSGTGFVGKEHHVDRPALSTESSSASSSSSSPYNNRDSPSREIHEVKPFEEARPAQVSLGQHQTQVITGQCNQSQVGSQAFSKQQIKLKRCFSHPSLTSISKEHNSETDRIFPTLMRSKSECNLHLIKSYSSSHNVAKLCAPKKLFASNYYQNRAKESSNGTNHKNSNEQAQSGRTESQTRFYRNYRKEVLECWDNEKRDIEMSRWKGDALDLSVNTPVVASRVLASENGFPEDGKTRFETLAHYADSASGDFIKPPVPHPLDLYRQYYYYLIHEPSFASRAAVAVAETYAKLLSNSNSPSEEKLNQQHTISSSKSSPPVLEGFEGNSLYETKRTSPDSLTGPRTELRSADTTNGNLVFDRKRISRPLTGKHVRHGTGASPATLVSLRNMIHQRQKLKEIGKFDCVSRLGVKAKANKRLKRK